MGYWQNKVVLVTGGSRGLGRVLAGEFARAGAKIVLAARQPDPLRQAADELRAGGATALDIPCDVTRDLDVNRMVSQIEAEFGRLDCLVNNAGRSMRRKVMETSPDDFADLLALNVVALVRVTRAAVPLLLRSRGHVVNIGSLGAKAAAKFLGAYPASKFAVAAYSQQLRLELGDQGLHTLLVCPGPIARDEDTSISASDLASVPDGARKPGGGVKTSLLDPVRLSRDILRACEKRQPELIRPRKARLLFALSSLSPRLGDWLISKYT